MANITHPYCQEFLAKTKHLRSIERSCYFALLRHLHKNGILPKDENALAKILNGKSTGPGDPFSLSVHEVRAVMLSINKELSLEYPERFPECVAKNNFA